MDAIALLADQRIREAMERGEFDNLPGAGKPVVLDDDAMVPEDLRAAYRILRNAGCLPPELEARKEIVTLRGLLAAAQDDAERRRIFREIDAKLLRLNLLRKRPLTIEDFPEYADRVRSKLAR